MLAEDAATQSHAEASAHALALPSVGAIVGERYRLTRLIGAGGMGTVFEAENLAVGRRCAIKFLRSSIAGCSRSTARFQRESRLLARLEHEHLTPVLDSGCFLESTPFFVMEYVEGETLKKALHKAGRLPLGLALDLIQQICQAMAYAHERGVVHRDLKPDNVMLARHSDGRPWVKILDFGVARWAEEREVQLTPTGADLGTAHYMSPEQARGASTVDARADVYALGAILYEMLTGERVHEGQSYNEVLFHLLTRAHRPLLELLPQCPGPVSDVVERCLRKEASERFADGVEMLKALPLVEYGQAPAASAQAPAARSASGLRVRLAWLGSGFVAGALIASVVAVQRGKESHALPTEASARPLQGASVAPSLAVGGAHPAPAVEPAEAPPSVREAPRLASQQHVESQSAAAPAAVRGGREPSGPPARGHRRPKSRAAAPEAQPSQQFPFLTTNPYVEPQ